MHLHALRALEHWIAVPRHGWQLAAFIGAALLIGIGAVGLLTATPHRYRKPLVMVVTFIAGLYFSVEFLIPRDNALTNWGPFLADATMVVGSFTVLLGIGSLFQIHGKAIAHRREGWYNSLAFFIGFFSILITGLLKDYTKGVVGKVSDETFGILFNGFLMSLNATMFSLVAFYIVSAAYRAFRVRSTEAALMMVAAAIIMLALVPIGVVLTSWIPEKSMFAALRLERLGPWILSGPNMAAQRAISFGIAVGALAMSLRIWLSLERGSFFDRQL